MIAGPCSPMHLLNRLARSHGTAALSNFALAIDRAANLVSQAFLCKPYSRVTFQPDTSLERRRQPRKSGFPVTRCKVGTFQPDISLEWRRQPRKSGFPDLVRLDRLGDHDGGLAAAPWPIDPARTKASWRLRIEGRAPSCTCLRSWSRINPAPSWVITFKIACDLEQLLDSRGNRATAGAIVGSQIVALTLAKQPPDIPDRAIRDGQFGRDLGQGYALLTTTHNLLAERHWEWSWHGSRLRSIGKRV